MNEIQQKVGLAWWQADQWTRLKEISEDRDNLEDTYEEWRKNAAKAFQEFEASGQSVSKVSINLEALLAWCNEKGVPVNAKYRAEYTAHVLQQRRYRRQSRN